MLFLSLSLSLSLSQPSILVSSNDIEQKCKYLQNVLHIWTFIKILKTQLKPNLIK